jgi:hypothetical protein
VTPETYKELAARAEKNGTSMTAVIEYLLRQSMIFEDFAKHEIMNVLHDFNSEGSKEAAYQGIPGDWTRDYGCYMRGARAAIQRLLQQAPGLESDGFQQNVVLATLRAQAYRKARKEGGVYSVPLPGSSEAPLPDSPEWTWPNE